MLLIPFHSIIMQSRGLLSPSLKYHCLSFLLRIYCCRLFSFDPSISRFINIYLSIYRSIYLSIYLFIYLWLFFIYLSIYLRAGGGLICQHFPFFLTFTLFHLFYLSSRRSLGDPSIRSFKRNLLTNIYVYDTTLPKVIDFAKIQINFAKRLEEKTAEISVCEIFKNTVKV